MPPLLKHLCTWKFGQLVLTKGALADIRIEWLNDLNLVVESNCEKPRSCG